MTDSILWRIHPNTLYISGAYQAILVVRNGLGKIIRRVGRDDKPFILRRGDQLFVEFISETPFPHFQLEIKKPIS